MVAVVRLQPSFFIVRVSIRFRFIRFAANTSIFFGFQKVNPLSWSSPIQNAQCDLCNMPIRFRLQCTCTSVQY